MADARYVVRSLLRARWFTAGAVLVFALGIGVNTATFAAIDQLLVRRLPYADSARLVVLRQCQPGARCGTAFPDAIANAKHATVGELTMVGFASQRRLTGSDDATPGVVLHATAPNLLRVLGVTPVMGRDITDDERRQGHSVVLLSYEAWQLRFAGQASVLGTFVDLPTGPAPVVGVLPRGFVPPSWGMPSATWEGLALGPQSRWFAPVARLAEGVSVDHARSEFATLVTTLATTLRNPRAAEAPLPEIRVDPLEQTLFEASAADARVIAVAAGLVLLLACANLAGLMLARGRARERDLAVRAALGASRRRLVAGVIVETGMVCLLGAAVATLVLWWTLELQRAVLPPLIARYTGSALELRPLAATVIAALACTLCAGARAGTRAVGRRSLHALSGASGTAAHRRLRGSRTVLALEATVGVVLIAIGASSVRSFWTLVDRGVGFDARALYVVTPQPRRDIPPTRPVPEEELARYREHLDVYRAAPGVVAVGGSDSVVGTGARAMRPFSSDRSIDGGRWEVTASYFDALKTPLLAGRPFTESEVATKSPVAILDLEAVRQVWPREEPAAAVGRILSLAGDVPRTVVGVVPQVRAFHADPDMASLYVPLGADPGVYRGAIVRLEDDSPETFTRFAEWVTARLGQPLSSLTVGDSSSPRLRSPRFRALLFTSLAGCGLLVAAGGIVALVLFSAAQRRRELAVRVALGADRRHLIRSMVNEVFWPVVAGAAVGVVGAWWAGELLQSLLFRTDARDPGTLTMVVVTLVGSAVLAAWIPARRASRVDPAKVLRQQ